MSSLSDPLVSGDNVDGDAPDPILLTLFANRFMGVAEAMGRSLQLTSVSTNIKERLDFSCALFAPNGDLIANAPHLPVHLGSMSFAVRHQVNTLGIGPDAEGGQGIEEGDVIMTNSPKAGGSHLPDITVITPVFSQTGPKEIVFFVASRGHHADIGGILPGSMPPTSTTIFQEGARIDSFKIVRRGKYDRAGLVTRLVDEPAKVEGSSGSRCFRDVESDLQAQISANHKGIGLIKQLIEEYSLEVVQRYMLHIRDNAELAVRNLLKEVAGRAETKDGKLHAIDYMDTGSPIQLTVTIDKDKGSAVFDFTGTGEETYTSLNAPISVCYSAVIYCLRAMVNEDIPLNAGCLAPIEIITPDNSIINPSETCAVVGGNVLTSQRITDVVFRAFEAVAASQGCMSNFTWGSGGVQADGTVKEGWGYYETICGGSGAGDGWHGESGVHSHMTNTRITDPETLERRYPVILHEFSIRAGSGGDGLYKGGDGVVRDLEFLEPLQVSILSERRVNQPYGLRGGRPGERGKNLWLKRTRKADGDWRSDEDPLRRINVGGRATIKVGKGDHFVIHTPGAGGWGEPGGTPKEVREARKREWEARGSLREREGAQLGA